MLKVGFSLTSEMCSVGVIFEHYIVVELSEKYNSFNLKRSISLFFLPNFTNQICHSTAPGLRSIKGQLDSEFLLQAGNLKRED